MILLDGSLMLDNDRVVSLLDAAFFRPCQQLASDGQDEHSLARYWSTIILPSPRAAPEQSGETILIVHNSFRS